MSLLSRLAVQAARAYGILSSGRSVNVPVSYLVVAGGGSGGGGNDGSGGGGGAGGYLTSTATLSTLNTYTVTVGAGAAATTTSTKGANGSNSVLSGTGITTITSTGGGAGGYNAATQANTGGSGGGQGGKQGSINAAGTAGQGNAGGYGYTPSLSWTGGGGGGASGNGGNGASGLSGAGGAGSASSISGSSVTRASGGSGGAWNSGEASGATAGGGGAGGGGVVGGGNATVNTGGGGGGGGQDSLGGAGGSGVVIISYTSATPKFIGGTLTTSGGNQIHTFTSSGTLSPLTPVTASYLVVAGGGAGGSYGGASGGMGGGGAGGLLTSSTTLYSGATYVVTVGAGGAVGSTIGNNGSDSSVSGTGITTLTATGGGGGGGGTNRNGASGGSGGGGAAYTGSGTGGAGTSGQGYAGGTASDNAPNYPAGGGGGAGGVGTSPANGSANSGNGGVGVSSSISGTATYYAGGGGGGTYTGSTTRGLGGNGGGGDGAYNTGSGKAVAGTTNLGGGGGGSANNVGAAAGGSGVVIISYAGSQVFNGGLVTSSGGNTIHTFNATGALTPLTNNLTNSLRFRKSASAYLSRTPTVTGNRKTFTWSGWVKRGEISTSGTNDYALMCVRPSSGVYTLFSIRSANAGVAPFAIIFEDSASTAVLATSNKFRDVAAWYHIVLAVDTTQATAANRVKIYINGNQVTSFDTYNTYPTLNSDMMYNTANPHNIGRDPFDTAVQFDGYMDDINFIDGQALEPYYFGNNDANGVWKPIKYTGMYGTNGFYLTFADTTSTTTIGYDTSGNSNNWTTNNISLTAGITYDAMLDVPTNTSATVANYCVKNPLVAGTGATITGANLNSTGSTTAFANARATFTLSSGKWYWEETITGSSIYDIGIGLVLESSVKSASNTRQTGWYDIVNASAGQVASTTNGGGFVNISTTDFATNDVIMVAYDADTGYIWFGKNGTWYPASTGGSAGNPAAGTNQTITAVSGLIPSSFHYNTNAGTASNFGQRPFSYTPPSGFVALNTFNLPTPTILQGNKYFDSTLYTGNGSTQVVVNNAQFKPDLVWAKSRSNTDTNSNGLVNSNVGRAGLLSSNQTSAEGTSPAGFDLVSFNSNGFTAGPASQTNMNTSGWTFVAWQWQAGQGTNTSNTSGSITSTVSVSTTAGFSIVTYTGTGANATVGHGLGVAPKMIIFKGRSSTFDWMVYHTSLGNTNYLRLNQSNASAASSSAFNNTSPTSTVFSLGDGSLGNNGSSTQLAYCWAEIAGFSKFGSYTGNGSADGPFVYLGFRPEFILFKVTSEANNWVIYDTSRDTYNYMGSQLYPSLGNAEAVSSSYAIDATANGFKIRTSNGIINVSSGTFIYAAFAENPFKNANAR